MLQAIQPHPMHVVQLVLRNRYGQWAAAWTGFIDGVRQSADPQGGETVTLTCTSPYKLWEITHATPGQTQDLAKAYQANVTASSVLQYSMRAIGYPLSMLDLDPQADAASGFQSSSLQSAFTTPDETTWSATIQALTANTGIEFFFTEAGRAVWRRVGYLIVPQYGYRPVLEEELLQHSLVEDDTGIITSLEVCFPGAGYVYRQAGRWPRDDKNPNGSYAYPNEARIKETMKRHLRDRHMPFYAPWIFSPQDAQNLATTLGLQFSSHILSGMVTIPADSVFQVGSVIEIPTRRKKGETAYYYVSTVTYQLTWGGSWAMTLGLSYGRAKDQSFPYNGRETYPTLTSTASFNSGAGNILTGVPSSGPVAAPFVVVRDDTLSHTAVSCDRTIFGEGSAIQVRDGKGALLGPSPNGDYITQAGQAGLVLRMRGTQASEAFVTVIKGVTATATSDPNVTDVGTPSTTVPPAFHATKPAPAPAPPPPAMPANASAATPGRNSLLNPAPRFIKITQGFGTGPNIKDTADPSWDGVGKFTPFHEGVDFGYSQSATLALINMVACCDGVVTYSGDDGGLGGAHVDLHLPGIDYFNGYGNCVIIQAGDLFFLYGHLANRAVIQGDGVKAGQPLGLVGQTGFASRVHLHFGVWNPDLPRGNWGGVSHGTPFLGDQHRGDWDNPFYYLPAGLS